MSPSPTSQRFTRFNISLPTPLLQALDEAAALHYSTRSEFIKKLVAVELQKVQQSVVLEPKAISDEQLEAAYNTLGWERARRAARKGLRQMRRQLHAGTLKDDD